MLKLFDIGIILDGKPLYILRLCLANKLCYLKTYKRRGPIVV